jgi:hypothetical protein
MGLFISYKDNEVSVKTVPGLIRQIVKIFQEPYLSGAYRAKKEFYNMDTWGQCYRTIPRFTLVPSFFNGKFPKYCFITSAPIVKLIKSTRL